MADAETTLNTHLAGLLDGMRHNWTVKTEQTRVMKKPARIDVLVAEDGWPRVIIECKMGMKSEDVDKRFDNRFRDDDTVPGVVFEVKYDASIGSERDLKRTEALSYCVHYDKHTRFPRKGWLTGSVRDLAVAIQYGRESVKWTSGADTLSEAITNAAKKIGGVGSRDEISHVMAQEASEQTDAMAALTLSGALMFHDMAAESKPERKIPLLGQIMFGGAPDIAILLEAWRSILKINYYPIFGPAREILARLPSDKAPHIIGGLHAANSRIMAMGLNGSSELYGQVFQRMIPDRKKLAAFYTKPAAAALLAAVTIPDEWRDERSVKGVRIADFACGTGALLLAAYKRIAANYEAASGGSMRDLHPHMMAKCLVGADVLPIAAHLTAAGLTGLYPRRQYDTTRIYQPIQGGGAAKLGSLEWIKPNATIDSSEKRLTGTGLRGTLGAPGHGLHDIVTMNPPYVRSQGPGGRSDQTDMRQMFTAFRATAQNIRQMNRRAAKLFKPNKDQSVMCADKRAGLATFFMDLAHAKLGGGGAWAWFCP